MQVGYTIQCSDAPPPPPPVGSTLNSHPPAMPSWSLRAPTRRCGPVHVAVNEEGIHGVRGEGGGSNLRI